MSEALYPHPWDRFGQQFHDCLVDTPHAPKNASIVDATVEVLEETLTTAAGLPAPLGEPVVHFSERVRHVRLGASRPCVPGPVPSDGA
jgi:hypothetical protein